MKKTAFLLVAVMALTTGDAQTGFDVDQPLAANQITSHPALTGETLYKINIKALRNFYSRYGDERNERWYSTSYGFRAKFVENGVAYMADYNRKGGWLNTIKNYGESELPKEIREKVRRQYYDQSIFFVQEINSEKDPIYLVSIEDKRSWMVIRLSGDEMETMASYRK